MPAWVFLARIGKHSLARAGGSRRAVPYLHLLIILALLVGASGCSKRTPTVQPVDSPPGVEQPETDPTGAGKPIGPGGASSGAGSVVTFAVYNFLGESYKPVIETFHSEHPDITVQVREVAPTGDPRVIASAADTAMLMFRPGSTESYFLDLSQFQQVDAEFMPESYWPGILEGCMDSRGQAYGLPLTTEMTGIFYHRKAFEDAGLPLPRAGWTWEAFETATARLAGNQDGQPVYGFADDAFMDTPGETILSTRFSYQINRSGGEIDPDALVEDLLWYDGLVKSGSLYAASIYPLAPQDGEAWSKAWNAEWSDFHAMFVGHPPAMWKGRLDGFYWADMERKALPDGSINMGGSSGPIIESKEGIGWVPYPVSAENDRTTPSQVTCGVISAGAENPRAAWTWLKYLAAHPILPEWSMAAPAQPAAAEASGFWGKIPEALWEPVRFGLEHGWYSAQHEDAVRAVNLALLRTLAENVEPSVALVEASNQLSTGIQPTPDAAPVVVAPPEPTVEAGETSIDFYSPLFFGGDRSNALVKRFNEQHPEITVNFATESDVQGVSGLADAFDCFAWLPEPNLPSEKVYDLNQFLATEPEDLLSEYAPAAVEEFSREGMVFGLPTVYRPNLIFYNADLLAERGLQPPDADWTYNEFIQMIQAASDNSGPEPIYGFALEYSTADMDMFLAGQGVRLVETTGGVPNYRFDTPETRSAVQWLAEQVEAGVIYPITLFPIGTYPQNFGSAEEAMQYVRELIMAGRVAFWMSWFDEGHGGAYSLEDAPFSIGVATIPLPEDGSWRPYHLAMGQYIARGAANPGACWEWIKFLSGQPDSDFGIPARRSVRESEGWAAQVTPEVAAVYQAALDQRRTRTEENVFGLGLAGDWWDLLLEEVIYVGGAQSVPAMLNNLQAKADAYAACLAASSDYATGTAEQKAQAETACADQANR